MNVSGVSIMTVPSCSACREHHHGHVVVSGSYGGRYNAYNASTSLPPLAGEGARLNACDR